MNILEVKEFYAQDKQKYNISKNKELLVWWKDKINNGYNSYVNIEVVQGLIDNIANWYEIKYPEREMLLAEGVRNDDFNNIEPLAIFMNIKQLMFRLPGHQLSLLECNYYANGCVAQPVYSEQGQVIEYKVQTGIKICKKTQDSFSLIDKAQHFYIFVDSNNGIVESSFDLSQYVNIDDNINLEELLELLKEKYNNELDLVNLEKCVYDHKCDIELRKKILEFVALKLLYSNNTLPHRGYERAKRFINEFNEELGLNLSTKEIDELFNKEYSVKKVRSLVKSGLKK